MRWCRGLRAETDIDERRKPNNVKHTAIQKPKSDRDPNAPKKGRFKGKGLHGKSAVASAITIESSEPMSDPPVSVAHLRSAHPGTSFRSDATTVDLTGDDANNDEDGGTDAGTASPEPVAKMKRKSRPRAESI